MDSTEREMCMRRSESGHGGNDERAAVLAELIDLVRNDPDMAARVLALLRPTRVAVVRAPDDAATHLAPLLAGQATEHVACVFLDGASGVIRSEVVASGGLAACIIEPRVILRRALACGATAFVVGHNHPSGRLEWSGEDRQATRALLAAGDVVGVKMMDHLLFAGADWCSWMAQGRA